MRDVLEGGIGGRGKVGLGGWWRGKGGEGFFFILNICFVF